MNVVRISEDFGIVVRRAALDQRGVSLQVLLQTMEVTEPLDQDGQLISFGPHFGGEAAQEFMRKLEQLGLIYDTDFFDFALSLPDWISLHVGLRVET